MNQTVMPDNPYAAPASALAEEAPREQRLADRGVRLAAVILDGIVFCIGLLPLFISVFLLGGMANLQDPSKMQAVVVACVAIGVLLFLGAVAWNCVLLQRHGQTVAKKWLGIRVVRRDGSRCGLARIFFARYLPVTLLSMVPFVGGLVSLVDALLIFRDDRRCLHDEIADTIVVVA